MNVIWKNYQVFPSQIKKYYGKPTYKFVGEYQDEFGEMTKCHSYVGDYFDNFENNAWYSIVNEMKNNRGRYFVTSGMRFKNRAEHLISADSTPVIIDSISKEDWNRKEVVPEPVEDFEHDLFTVE